MFVTGKRFQLCYKTVQLIGPIRKLQRKWSVVNTVPGVLLKKTKDTCGAVNYALVNCRIMASVGENWYSLVNQLR